MKRIVFGLIFIAASTFAFAEGGPGNTWYADNPIPCHTASLSGVNVSCYGLANGSATLTINQPGTYRVIWSNGVVINSTTSLTHSISGLTAGYYDVQVINIGNGCSAFDIINITQPAVLTTTHTQVDVKCFGLLTGSINLSVSGGTPGYNYIWSSGPTTQDISGIGAGNYLVTVTDFRGCQARDTVDITQPAQALGQSYTSLNPNCFGSSDAWIDLTVWGGTTPYVYNWNSGAFASQDLDNILAGNYSVVVTDANNCTISTAVTLINPPLLTLSSTSVDNLCYGASNGSINLTTIGGTLPYTYVWANTDYLLSWSTEDLSNLPNSEYFVTVVDSKGCFRIDSAEITSPNQLTSSITSTNVTTFGGSNGSINLTVTGGIGPYIILWSNGNTNPNLSGIPAGWYSVLITDNNGCQRDDSVYISEPLDPLTAELELTHVTCFGGSNGAINAVASGGTQPYTFHWSTGSASSEIGDLNAGIYSLTVTDFFGNTYLTSDTIVQPDAISFAQVVTNVSCNGLPNGIIDVTVSGGTPSYIYEWYNSEYVLAALTEDISGMPADQYYLQVTDTLGCSGSLSISITQPDILQIEMDRTNVNCAGGATGTGHCTVTGGTLPYTFQWSNGASTPDITALAAGVYVVTVTDAHFCFMVDSIRITQTDSLNVDFTMVPVSCIDQHDGKATAFASGGNGDYTYLWNNSATTSEIEDLEAGLYNISVTDLMGCSGTGAVTVTKMEIECINIPTCFTPNDDGLNDVWVIKDASLYPEFSLKIYNRWGLIVYEIAGSYEAWDGTFKGEPIPAATYYYFLQLSAQSEVRQGTITIVR
jgi:gliding motility-associated-like protein